MNEKRIQRHIRPRFRIKVVRPHLKRPAHLPRIMIGLTALIIITRAIQEKKKPTAEDLKASADATMRGLLLL
jgi:hypothetical protein